MGRVSLRQLKQRAETIPKPFTIHAQLASLVEKTSRAGKPFFEAKLADAEESLTLRLWEESALYKAFSKFSEGDFIGVSGDWVRNDPYGIEPRDAKAEPLSKEALEALLQGPDELRRKQAEDYAAVEEFVAAMEDPRLRGVAQRFLDQFGSRLKRTAAARSYHHARRGGLVEHLAQMMRTADAICPVYSELNRDLILAGVLFHDCGKLWENAYAAKDFAMPYTEVGELLGHIPFGMELVNKLWREMMEEPEASSWKDLKPANDQVRLHLLHLIASHHGEHAFGSPTLPRTPEAVALHYVDNLDAKLEMFARGYETSRELSKSVLERVRPLPANLVRPLPRLQTGEDEPEAPF